jgi:hypothetical protein
MFTKCLSFRRKHFDCGRNHSRHDVPFWEAWNYFAGTLVWQCVTPFPQSLARRVRANVLTCDPQIHRFVFHCLLTAQQLEDERGRQPSPESLINPRSRLRCPESGRETTRVVASEAMWSFRTASPEQWLYRFDQVLDQAALFSRRDSDTRQGQKAIGAMVARALQSEDQSAPTLRL